MAGDPTNAALWQGADVFIAPVDTDAPVDVTTAWADGWDAVGLLSGDDGFVMSRAEDTNDFYAWGGILVKSTKSNQRRTIKFVALEDNDTVFALVNPGSTRSTASGLSSSIVLTPQNNEFAIGFELRDGDKVKRRTVKRASVDVIGDSTESETALASIEITIVILPEADGELYREVSGSTAAAPDPS